MLQFSTSGVILDNFFLSSLYFGEVKIKNFIYFFWEKQIQILEKKRSFTLNHILTKCIIFFVTIKKLNLLKDIYRQLQFRFFF